MSNPNPHRPRVSEQRSRQTAVKSTNRAPPEVGENPQGFRTRQPGHLRAIKTPSSQDFVNILRTGSISVADIVSRLPPRYDEPPTGPLISAAEQLRSRLKTLQPHPPLWKEQDEVQEEIVLSNKRNREQGGFEQTSAPRMSITRRAQRKTARIVDEGPHRISKKAYLGPEMSLMRDGEVLDDSDMEVHEELPQVGRKTTKMVVPRMQSLVPRRAARKTHIDTSSSSNASSADEEPDTSSGDDSSDDDDTMEDEVGHDFRVKQEEGEEIPRPFGPAELVDLCSPPKITIPLPQISHRPPAPPTSTLIALERLTFPTARMQETKQLPFLVRSLRKGFLLRCRDLGKDWKVKSRKVTLHLRYEGSNNEVIESKVTSWRCPLCSLHGVFPARRPLELHIQWDHNEVTAAWTFQNDNSWLLRIALYNTIPEVSDSDIKLPVLSRIKPEPKEEELDFGNTTMFPFVEVSPPASPTPSSTRASLSTDPPSSDTLSSGTSTTPRRDTEGIRRDFPTLPLSATKYPSRFPLHKQPGSTSTGTSTRDSLTTTSSLSQHPSTGREETVSRSSLFSTSTNDTAGPAHVDTGSLRYPTPPPPDDPFGPSARPPYLPAKSDYGGPTVYYSCRPAGPSLLDLLGTLPMDEFGVLDWTVTDKEEEIFESDDVKDVHKVMHALWNRWIIINRPAFIADYHKGIIAFVDQYWKMIHRAAGWNALRYWLMLMLANRFLTAKEVAETLKHYEKYTGMEYWANAS